MRLQILGAPVPGSVRLAVLSRLQRTKVGAVKVLTAKSRALVRSSFRIDTEGLAVAAR
jgi:hypothetical protein